MLVINGPDDAVVGRGAGQRLYDAAGEPRALWSEEGVGRVAMSRAFPEEYERRAVVFLDGTLLAGR